ncbi:MAG TPA: gamma-glutamylcyclotransferase family protein [Gemmatimonadales bacterium]|nr:gamma-glutamylcyclotransferase family protein [Gemmatimonadales bacterium]
MTTYFAYGANMDPLHMAEHCPGAVRLGTAVLDGHAFGIGAGHYGTVRPGAGSAVHGVLWRLTPGDEAALDEFEGVAKGFYRKDTRQVRAADGAVVTAMIYRPVDDAPGIASRRYLERIIEVAEGLGFPEEYVGTLRSHRRG